MSYDSVRGASREYSTHIQKFRATLSCATRPQSVPPKRGLSWFVILELPMSDAPDFLADLSPRIASTFFDQFGDQFLHVNSVVPNYDQVCLPTAKPSCWLLSASHFGVQTPISKDSSPGPPPGPTIARTQRQAFSGSAGGWRSSRSMSVV